MKRAIFIAACLALLAAGPASALTRGWESGVGKALGREGRTIGSVYKVTFPRTDLDVRVSGIAIDPAFALTSWVSFQPARSGVMAMGDLVLTADEVRGVQGAMVARGFSVTAVHQHLMGEVPQLTYMHFMAEGEPLELSRQLKEIIALTGTPLYDWPEARREPSEAGAAGPDWSRLENVLGRSGEAKGDVLAFTFPRKEKIKDMGVELQPAMGTGTVANFQMLADEAVAAGDFAVSEDEAEQVFRTLVKNGFTVSALHTHMLHEAPKLYYMHFWGQGDPVQLAKVIREALRQTSAVIRITE